MTTPPCWPRWDRRRHRRTTWAPRSTRPPAAAAGRGGAGPPAPDPLAIAPVPTGTSLPSRFIDQLGDSSRGKEQTRQGVQEITVRMPPPRYVDAILDPDLVAHGDPMSAGGGPILPLRPAPTRRLAEGDNTFGTIGTSPTSAQLSNIGAAPPA